MVSNGWSRRTCKQQKSVWRVARWCFIRSRVTGPSCESRRGVAGRRFVSEVQSGCRRLLFFTGCTRQDQFTSMGSANQTPARRINASSKLRSMSCQQPRQLEAAPPADADLRPKSPTTRPSPHSYSRTSTRLVSAQTQGAAVDPFASFRHFALAYR